MVKIRIDSVGVAAQVKCMWTFIGMQGLKCLQLDSVIILKWFLHIFNLSRALTKGLVGNTLWWRISLMLFLHELSETMDNLLKSSGARDDW